MPYVTDGTLTTDKREVAVSETWDSQSDWEAYQSKSGVVITSGALELSQITTVDTFDDGDIAEYGGNTGNFSVQSTTAVSGSALQKDTVSNYDSISSTSGLDTYPSIGDTVEWRMYIVSGNWGGFRMMTQSETANPDGYRFKVDPAGGNLEIEVRSGGSDTTLNGTSISGVTGEWLRAESTVESDGSITLVLYDSGGSEIATVTANDSTFTSGGIGFDAYDSGDPIYFDEVLIV